MSDHPWREYAPAPGRQGSPAAWRRYNRALRLSEAALRLSRPSNLRSTRTEAYWRWCIEHWRDYLDGAQPPDWRGGPPMQE